MGGGAVTRATGDGLSGDSGPAVKQYVDANISISPNGVNEVGTPHTFTIVVNASPAGTGAPSYAITASVSPTPGTLATNCGSPVLSNGGNTATCSLTINNPTSGDFTAKPHPPDTLACRPLPAHNRSAP